MASINSSAALEIPRFPLSNYVDAIRFLPVVSAIDQLIAAAVHNPDSSSLNLYSLHHDDLLIISSFPLPSPVSSLSLSSSTHHPVLAAAAACSGALHLLTLHPSSASHRSVSDGAFHAGTISEVVLQAGGEACVTVGADGKACVTVGADGKACVTVGADGRINLVRFVESRVSYERSAMGEGCGSSRQFGGVGVGVCDRGVGVWGAVVGSEEARWGCFPVQRLRLVSAKILSFSPSQPGEIMFIFGRAW